MATFLQATSSTADLTTYTFASQNLGTAHADRYIIVTIAGRRLGALSVSSVTIGGVTATIIAQAKSPEGDVTSNAVAIAVANVPTGTTGDVVVTWNAGLVRCGIGLYRAVGLGSTTAYDFGVSEFASAPTDNLNVPVDGFAVGVAISAAATTTTWTGLTEDFDDVVESLVTYSGGLASVPAGETGRTLTATFASSTHAAGAFASWAESTPSPSPHRPSFFWMS